MVDTMWLEDFAKDIMAETPGKSPRTEIVNTKVRKPWRSGKYTVYLWEFLCSLLQDPDCYSIITWTNRNKKEFKMVDVGEVAKLWGTVKNRPKMDAKKLLRALRYYYKTNILRKVKGEKGVYQFLAIPYELNECESAKQISDVPIPFQVNNKCEYRERTESTSSSTITIDDDDFYEDFMFDLDPMVYDEEFSLDNILKAIDSNMS